MTSMTAFFGFLIGFFFLGSLYMLYKNNRQYNKPFVEFLTEMLIMLILMIFISTIAFDNGSLFGFVYPYEYLVLIPLMLISIKFKAGVNTLFFYVMVILVLLASLLGYSEYSVKVSESSLLFFELLIFTITFAMLLMLVQKGKILKLEYEKELLAILDELTGVGNRRYFNEMLNYEINRSERYGDEFSMIMFDIDYFKKINDTYGHDKGDTILQKMASLVESELRLTDNFARWGGEEFIILLPQSGLDNGIFVAEKLRAMIEEQSFEVKMDVTCSFGVIVYEKNDTPESMIHRVEKRLYSAKEGGRNRVVSA